MFPQIGSAFTPHWHLKQASNYNVAVNTKLILFIIWFRKFVVMRLGVAQLCVSVGLGWMLAKLKIVWFNTQGEQMLPRIVV